MLKTLFYIVIGLILFAAIIPLVWLVINEANSLLGDLSIDTDVWYIVLFIVSLIIMLWCIIKK